MTYSEINAVEQAGRSALAWAPEGYDGKTHYAWVMSAALPAIAILGVAASVLFAVW